MLSGIQFARVFTLISFVGRVRGSNQISHESLLSKAHSLIAKALGAAASPSRFSE
tara:strand:+ start:563 stop:727 length:165 start_codon:yes stop_codon:yes gene_type:complete